MLVGRRFTVPQPAVLIKKKIFFIKKRRAGDGKTSPANQASSVEEESSYIVE
jgi:hypothetical protein